MRVAFDASTGPLQQDDRAASRVDTRPKQFKGPATRNREPLGQDLAVRPDEVAVVTRIEQEQRHARDVAVAQFQGEAPLERLSVPRSGLGFDAVSPVRAKDHGIPGTEVTRNRERDLRHEPE